MPSHPDRPALSLPEPLPRERLVPYPAPRVSPMLERLRRDRPLVDPADAPPLPAVTQRRRMVDRLRRQRGDA